jgi:S-formylglutathione hydrolase FrmB
MHKLFIFCLLVFLCRVPCDLTAGSADTITVSGPVSFITAKAIVVLPDSYRNSDKSFPVVYLLHGWSGNYRNWYDKADLEPLADKYQLILACPDGGYDGWYIDSPVDTAFRYQTYVAREVVAYMDSHYHTIAHETGRAVCGLSMGGHGAFRILTLYPDSFSMAGCMSGVMELSASTNRYGLNKLLGPFDQFPDRWHDYSCTALVDSLVGKDKNLLIDCGISDRFIKSNRDLHQRLIEAGVAHDYVERPGGHSWDYWIGALEYHLLFFVKHGLTVR